MSRVVWGRRNSSNVMKVVWLLEELSLPYERREAGGTFGIVDTPAYREMNPNGLVPTLEEDGFTLWESNAILRYLADGHEAVWPADRRKRADIDRWMDWQQTTLAAMAGPLFLLLVRKPEAERTKEAVAAASERAAAAWSRVAAAIEAGAAFGGEQPRLADFALGPHLHRWMSFAIDKPSLPALDRWYAALLARPAYSAHVALPLS